MSVILYKKGKDTDKEINGYKVIIGTFTVKNYKRMLEHGWCLKPEECYGYSEIERPPIISLIKVEEIRQMNKEELIEFAKTCSYNGSAVAMGSSQWEEDINKIRDHFIHMKYKITWQALGTKGNIPIININPLLLIEEDYFIKYKLDDEHVILFAKLCGLGYEPKDNISIPELIEIMLQLKKDLEIARVKFDPYRSEVKSEAPKNNRPRLRKRNDN